MINIKNLLLRHVNQILFTLLVLTILFIAAAFSLMPLVFLFIEPPLFIHLYAIVCFAALLYLPSKLWFCFILPSLWLDLMLETFLGWHLFLVALQYGTIFFMRKFLKGYGFLFHWAIFSLSYSVIFTFLNPFNLYQNFLTILLYPLLFNWLARFFYRFRWMNYG